MIVPAEGLVLNVFKPVGITSFEVVRRLRRILKVKRVGHCGTLDPFAEGVLIIVVGKATKRAGEFSAYDKVYRAGIRLGRITDTYDITGKTILEKDISKVTLEDIEPVIERFKGEIEQIPPMFSAIKISGQPLYKLARKGQEITRKPRRVIFHNITLDAWQNPILNLTVCCSKGTYIRSLAFDIGNSLGCGACLDNLTRIAVGPFRIEDAIRLEEIL